MRTFTIVEHADGHFDVYHGEKIAYMLGWDEMLGEIASLTHQKLGAGRYSMHVDAHISRMERSAELRRKREQNPDLDHDFKEIE